MRWLIAAWMWMTPAAFAADRPPDVYVVVWDTFRADHAGFMGHTRPTTPNLDRIAKGGTVFERSMSCAHWTLPSVACVFSGLYTHNHMVSFDADKGVQALPPSVHTLAQAFRDKGYATALITSWPIIIERGRMTDGFDVVKPMLSKEERVHPEALAFVDAHPDVPRFVVLYYLDPHAPYVPDAAHSQWVDPKQPPLVLAHNARRAAEHADQGWVWVEDIESGKIILTPAQWEQLRARYDGEIRQNDDYLGQFWKGLTDRGLADTSAFVFFSDHGEAFGEHRRKLTDHSRPYDTILHVPLVMRWPGTWPVRRVPSVVRTMDLTATLVESFGLSFPYALDAQTLSPLFKGTAPGRTIGGFSSTHCGTEFFRDGQYKYIRCRKGEGVTDPEVYDLVADPAEQHNLAASRPDLVKALQAKLAAWVSASKKNVAEGAQRASEDDLKALEALGYVE